MRSKLLPLAACVSALAFVAVASAGEKTGSAVTGQKVIQVLEVGTADRNLDGQGDGPPKAGDRFYFANALYSWAGTKRGKRIGRDEGLCTFTSVNVRNGHVGAFCTAQFFLPGGSLTAQAFLRFTEGPGRFNVPITGGTGAFVNATGLIHIRDIGRGDSSNSALTFHLTT